MDEQRHPSPEAQPRRATDAVNDSPTDGQHHVFTPTLGQPLNELLPAFHLKRPSVSALSLQTDIYPPPKSKDELRKHESFPDLRSPVKSQRFQESSLLSRPPMITNRSFDGNSNVPWSPSSTASSPALNALGDVTPLPSPLLAGGSPEFWKGVGGRPSSGSLSSLSREEGLGILPAALVNRSSSRKKKLYPNLQSSPPKSHNAELAPNHSRNRSISEYVPDALQNARQRNVSAPAVEPEQTSIVVPIQTVYHLQREEYIAAQRKIIPPPHSRLSIPTPPPSNRSITDSSEDGEDKRRSNDLDRKLSLVVIYDAQHQPLSYWQPIRQLGHGAFSEVLLAKAVNVGEHVQHNRASDELVAIKVVSHDHGNQTSDEQRMEVSIKREIDILQSISHPCLPQLLAFENSGTRALLVLNYCAGGDLFELASQHRALLTTSIIRRIAAELVGAVSYLHAHGVVHRDIKLENVLFNIDTTALLTITDPQSYSFPLTTLTDLGLSRRVAPGEMLSHPCGSADYAAPELLLGQQYDGRATDTWALGVLMYALLEGRLPFDPLPGARRQASAKHRIARCDWVWCELGDADGEWAGGGVKNGRSCRWSVEEGVELEGAREVVEGMLRKVSRKSARLTLEEVARRDWIAGGVRVEGGLVRKPL